MKKLIYLLLVITLFASCANSKTFNINGKNVEVQPYGWMNQNVQYNDSINYQINAGNIVLDVILSETIIVPVILTGDALYEPVSKK